MNLSAQRVETGRIKGHRGIRVYADVELKTIAGKGTAFTIDHEEIPNEYARFSASWYLIGRDRDGHRYESGGQVDPADRELGTTFVSPEDVALLDELWKEWHLNDVQAGCSHMPAFEDIVIPDDWTPKRPTYGENDRRSTYAIENLTCPESGYRWGSKWLVRTIPADVIDQMTGLIERLNRANA